MSESKSPPSDGSPGVRVAVIGQHAADARYPMFEVDEIAADGAFFGGGLLLENGEEFDAELSFADNSTLTLRAQVVGITAGERPGIRVVWSQLADSERALLVQKLTNGNEIGQRKKS